MNEWIRKKNYQNWNHLVDKDQRSKQKQASGTLQHQLHRWKIFVGQWMVMRIFFYTRLIWLSPFSNDDPYIRLFYTHTHLDWILIQFKFFFYCIFFFLHNHNNNNKITTTVSLFQIQNNMQNVKCLWPKDGVVTKTQWIIDVIKYRIYPNESVKLNSSWTSSRLHHHHHHN